MNNIKELLAELREYFDQRADAEYFTDSAAPVPNEEMKMLQLVETLQAVCATDANHESSLVSDYARCLDSLGANIEVGEELPTCLGEMLDEILSANATQRRAAPEGDIAKIREAANELADYDIGTEDLVPELFAVAERLSTNATPPRPEIELLGDKHNGMRISAEGVLGRVKGMLKPMSQEMLKQLEGMAEAFYSGNVKAVDQFLQTWDLDDKRPNPPQDQEGE